MESHRVALLLLLILTLAHCRAFSICDKGVKVVRSSKYRCHQLKSSRSSDVEGTSDRRALLHSLLAAGTTLGFMPLIPSRSVAATGAEAFLGKYSDPINHPGGTRTIKLVDGAVVGDYQLAKVEGGGGRGEPNEYVLPAVVVGDRAIIIDFSPKGGPRDFTGVLTKEGIKFTRDGNLWPRFE